MNNRHKLASGITAMALMAAGAAHSATLEISITNNQEAGGLYLTPLLTVLHDGSYNAFDAGSQASAGVQAIAEGGDVSIERAAVAAYNSAVITSPGGFVGAPVIDPGETASIRIEADPTSDRFLTFLSMVIPSNDSFIGNDNPFAYELFDDAGVFTNINPIEVLGNEVWDAGTEANTGFDAAFNTAGGPRTAENGTVHLAGSLDFLLGSNTAAGTSVTSVPSARERLATIQIAAVPLPASLLLMFAGLGGLGIAGKRKRA